MSDKSALLLTHEEWDALRNIANSYLMNTVAIDKMPETWRGPVTKARVLCERIMEVT